MVVQLAAARTWNWNNTSPNWTGRRTTQKSKIESTGGRSHDLEIPLLSRGEESNIIKTSAKHVTDQDEKKVLKL